MFVYISQGNTIFFCTDIKQLFFQKNFIFQIYCNTIKIHNTGHSAVMIYLTQLSIKRFTGFCCFVYFKDGVLSLKILSLQNNLKFASWWIVLILMYKLMVENQYAENCFPIRVVCLLVVIKCKTKY